MKKRLMGLICFISIFSVLSTVNVRAEEVETKSQLFNKFKVTAYSEGVGHCIWVNCPCDSDCCEVCSCKLVPVGATEVTNLPCHQTKE